VIFQVGHLRRTNALLAVKAIFSSKEAMLPAFRSRFREFQVVGKCTSEAQDLA